MWFSSVYVTNIYLFVFDESFFPSLMSSGHLLCGPCGQFAAADLVVVDMKKEISDILEFNLNFVYVCGYQLFCDSDNLGLLGEVAGDVWSSR